VPEQTVLVHEGAPICLLESPTIKARVQMRDMIYMT
jgi:hypothetical protein